MATFDDIKTIIAGAAAWAVAVPAVKFAGRAVVSSSQDHNMIPTGVALVVGAGIAVATTPLLSKILDWKTPQQKVRGIALALGTAQTIDGLVHFLAPTLYDNDPRVGLACAANIFYGAGLLGIMSAYQ